MLCPYNFQVLQECEDVWNLQFRRNSVHQNLKVNSNILYESHMVNNGTYVSHRFASSEPKQSKIRGLGSRKELQEPVSNEKFKFPLRVNLQPSILLNLIVQYVLK